MVSDFLVSHPSGPFFSLYESEWNACTEKYQDILQYNGTNIKELLKRMKSLSKKNRLISNRIKYYLIRYFKKLV